MVNSLLPPAACTYVLKAANTRLQEFECTATCMYKADCDDSPRILQQICLFLAPQLFGKERLIKENDMAMHRNVD